VDSAAQASIIASRVVQSMEQIPIYTENVQLKGIADQVIPGRRLKGCPVEMGGILFRWDFLEANIEDDLLLGFDFLLHFGCKIDCERLEFKIHGQVISCELGRTGFNGRSYPVIPVMAARKEVIPPGTTRMISGRIDTLSTGCFVVSPTISGGDVLVPYSIGRVNQGEVPVYLLNPTDSYVVLRSNQHLGYAEEVDSPGEFGSTENISLSRTRRITCGVNENCEDIPSASESGCKRLPDTEQSASSDERPQLQLVPAHLCQLYENSRKHLTDEQRLAVAELLSKYETGFSKGDADLGCFTAVKHSIDTGDARPIRQRMRRTALGFQEEEDKLLEKMLSSGVVEESNSEWASPSVLVRKKDGSVRWCIDFRAVNSVTIKDAYPLPNITECLDTLSGSEFFSTLDMASGYWQIEVEKKDRHKTAFLTKHGLFEFTRMPFGLCNSPSTFQRAVHHVFRGMNWSKILTYLDDLMVVGKGFEEHMSNLQQTFERLQRFHLKLKPKKCNLFQTQVLFLGKLVSQAGVAVNPESLKVVLEWAEPTSAERLHSFLGLINYHREHIKNFAEISSSLYSLVKPKAIFEWNETHQRAFKALKEALVCAPVLVYPTAKGLFILDTDASEFAIGAELLQIQDGEEKVISYGSYILIPPQKKYCTTRKELLALIRFCRQYRHYLLGRPFIIRTDHNSLTWLMRFRHIEGQLARWLEELSQFDMVIQHRPGKQHSNADSLSRRPDEFEYCNCYQAGVSVASLPCGGCRFCTRAHEQWARFEDDVDDVIPLAVRSLTWEEAEALEAAGTSAEGAVSFSVRSLKVRDEESVGMGIPSETEEIEEWAGEIFSDADESMEVIDSEGDEDGCNWLDTYTHAQLRESQISDVHLEMLIKWLEDRITPSQHELYLSSPAVKRFWMCRSQLCFHQRVLYYCWEEYPQSRWLLMVPSSLQEEVLHGCHDSPTGGHLGQQKTYQRLKQNYLWHEMSVDAKLYVKSCSVCNKSKKPNVKPKAGLGSYHAGAPMEKVHIDMLGPLPESRIGNKYVLMMVDQFTKWVEIHAVPDQSADRTAKTVVNQFFSRFGSPFQIHSDQGKNFDGHLFKAVCQLYRVTKTRTTPYRPCSNGQVERYNRLLLQLVRCYLRGKQNTWDEDLQLLAAAIRAMPNRQTGFSANLLFLGREVNSPVELLMGAASANLRKKEPAAYVTSLRETLAEVGNLTRRNLKASQANQKRLYDLHLQEKRYAVGDAVYKLNAGTKTGESKKLKPVWGGPFVVMTVLSSALYRVKDRKGEYVMHHDRMKLCEDRCLPMWLRRLRHGVLELDTTLAYEEEEAEPLEGSQALDLVDAMPEDILANSSGHLVTLDENSTTEESIVGASSSVDSGLPESAISVPPEQDITAKESMEGASSSVDSGPPESASLVPPEQDSMIKESMEGGSSSVDSGPAESEESAVGASSSADSEHDSSNAINNGTGGIAVMAEAPRVSRRGRQLKRPAYLADYEQ